MRRILCLAAVLRLTASLAAAVNPPTLLNAWINYGVTPNQIIIDGAGFSPKGLAPQVIFNNGLLNPLVSFTDSVIVANLVKNQPPATYLLVVTNSQGSSSQMYVTLGTEGP